MTVLYCPPIENVALPASHLILNSVLALVQVLSHAITTEFVVVPLDDSAVKTFSAILNKRCASLLSWIKPNFVLSPAVGAWKLTLKAASPLKRSAKCIIPAACKLSWLATTAGTPKRVVHVVVSYPWRVGS